MESTPTSMLKNNLFGAIDTASKMASNDAKLPHLTDNSWNAGQSIKILDKTDCVDGSKSTL